MKTRESMTLPTVLATLAAASAAVLMPMAAAPAHAMTALPAVAPAIPCPQLASINFASGSGAAEVEFRVSSATVPDIVPPGRTAPVPTCQ